MEVLSVRVPREVKEELERLARLGGKAEVVRKVLVSGVRERKVEAALKLYSEGRVTPWRSAELAGAEPLKGDRRAGEAWG